MEVHRSDEVVYAGYRIVVLSSNKHDDSLVHISGKVHPSWKDTDLHQKEKANVK